MSDLAATATATATTGVPDAVGGINGQAGFEEVAALVARAATLKHLELDLRYTTEERECSLTQLTALTSLTVLRLRVYRPVPEWLIEWQQALTDTNANMLEILALSPSHDGPGASESRLLEAVPSLRELHLICENPGEYHTALPQGASALSRLELLVLQNMSSGDEQPVHVDDTVWRNLPRLRTLLLGDVQWHDIPLALCTSPGLAASLQVLTIQYSPIRRLRPELSQLTSLRRLVIKDGDDDDGDDNDGDGDGDNNDGGNDKDDTGGQRQRAASRLTTSGLSAALSSLVHLEKLVLHGFRRVPPLPASLSRLVRLRRLRVGCRWSDSVFHIVAPELYSLRLKSAEFDHCVGGGQVEWPVMQRQLLGRMQARDGAPLTLVRLVLFWINAPGNRERFGSSDTLAIPAELLELIRDPEAPPDREAT